MRQNKPRTVAGTLSLGGFNLQALRKGVVVTRLVTAADYAPALAALEAAAGDFAGIRSVKRGAQRELDRCVAEARVFIRNAVGLLGAVFGRRFSATWTQLGFVRNLRVPWTHAGRQLILRCTAAYLESHPDAQSTACGVTAQRARELSTAYDAALAAVQRARTNVRAGRNARTAAMKALLKLMNDLLHELAVVLAPDDVRWRGFGFNIPAAPSVPEAVAGLEVKAVSPGTLSLAWERSARAERYHVELLLPGPESAFHRVLTVYDTDARLKELPPGAAVQVRVLAVNAGGESAPGEVVPLTVPALQQAA